MTISADLVSDLREAVASGALSIAYQPQFELDRAGVRSGPVAVEGLCRWVHGGEPVPPSMFIPLAEDAHILEEIDLFMLAQGSMQVAAWRRAGHDVALATNASPSHLTLDYADAVMARLDELAVDPATVTLEITESPSPSLFPDIARPLTRLQSFGLAISIDDYGAGDITLAMIEALPIDEVKIDRSLSRRADAEADDIVAEVIERARRNGWRTVAEGIETQADLDRALARGCDRAQGYLLGRPMAVEELEALFSE